MEERNSKKSIIILLFIWPLLANSDSAPPETIIYRVDPNGKPTSVLNKVPNSEVAVIMNERLWFRCKAAYPVQWIYLGNGAADFLTTTSKGKESSVYRAELKINKTTETHTGKFKCSSTEQPALSTYFYMFVPGPDLFTAEQGKIILFSDTDPLVVIPCTVSQKNARVTLQKSVEDVLQGPLLLRDRYDPKVGFKLRLSEQNHPTGIYVCSATYGNIFRLIEYTVMSMDAVNRANVKSCIPSPCGKNAKCEMLGSFITCSCIMNFNGDPYTSCRKPCNQGSDCPVDYFCNSTSKSCEDPCKGYACDSSVSECRATEHSPACYPKSRVKLEACGKKPSCPSGSKCKTTKGGPQCICAKDFLGDDPEMGCYASCQNNADCSSAKSCDYPSCIDSCVKFNPCGVNANCIVRRHNRICECKEGHTGNPTTKCHKILNQNQSQVRVNLTSGENPCGSCGPHSYCNLSNGKVICTCKLGYLGRPPNCRVSCTSHENCDSKQACIAGRCANPCTQSRVCGSNAECIPEKHKPTCNCESGYTGNPMERCTAVVITEDSDFSVVSPRCQTRGCQRRPSANSTVEMRLEFRDVKYDD